jgi:hypothetical protein
MLILFFGAATRYVLGDSRPTAPVATSSPPAPGGGKRTTRQKIAS